MNLERFIATLGPTEVVNEAPVDVRDVAYDSRVIVPGTLFFCVRGTVSDGHAFAPAAVEAGAVAIVVEERLEVEVPQLVVPSIRAAMATAAVLSFGDPSHELEVA